jgi:hypothetical protein
LLQPSFGLRSHLPTKARAASNEPPAGISKTAAVGDNKALSHRHTHTQCVHQLLPQDLSTLMIRCAKHGRVHMLEVCPSRDSHWQLVRD